MQSASFVFVKCQLNNFQVASCNSGNLLWVVSYNSIICELQAVC